jgi:two-component system cell cycle response regulator CpdR
LAHDLLNLPERKEPKGVVVEVPKRILIVDDEIDFLFSASLALRQAGYDVCSAGSPVKAVETAFDASRQEKPFDLMITDLRMPMMSGAELVEVLRERGIPLHVLTISSVCAKGILCTMDCSCGANHLDKPFEPRELVERVGRILEGHAMKKWPTRGRPESVPGNVPPACLTEKGPER